jgi:hypothetical protein
MFSGSLKEVVPKFGNGGHDDKAHSPVPPAQLIPYVLAWNLFLLHFVVTCGFI